MGAWTYVLERLPALLGPGRRLRYAGRDEAASPATGSYRTHAKEQSAIVAALFEGAPATPGADDDGPEERTSPRAGGEAGEAGVRLSTRGPGATEE